MLRHVQLFVTPWTLATPGTSVYGILQAIILEWVAISSSGDLPNPGIKPKSPALQADSLPLSHQKSPQTDTFNSKQMTRFTDFRGGKSEGLGA